MKYLRKFETEADVAVFVKPNVVLVGDTGEVLYNVELPNGVYIQHIDGTLFTTEQWTAGGFANEEANGVAVKNSKIQAVIALTNASTSIQWSSDTTNLISGVCTIDDEWEVYKDLAGVANTAILAEIDESGAAFACANYTFPNGAKGYLPSAGELMALYGWDAVHNAISLVGGASLIGRLGYEKLFWTSTQASAEYAWLINVRSGQKLNFTKDYQAYARPFLPLEL